LRRKGSTSDPLPKDRQYYKHANMGYLNYAQDMGWIQNNRQIVLQLYSEVLQKFRLAARGHGDVQPPESERERIETYFDPLPLWHRPFEEALVSQTDFPMHALTQRPMQMYHSWGSQNAWLRQIHGYNRLCMHRDLAKDLGVGDDDWVHVESHHGRIKAQVRTMTGCERNTVWTWNAIGKRRGAWNLEDDAAEGENQAGNLSPTLEKPAHRGALWSRVAHIPTGRTPNRLSQWLGVRISC